MKKRIIPLVVLLVVAVIAVVAWRRRGGDDEQRLVRLSGNIELTEINIAFKMPGRVVEILLDEGAPVKKGMVLARLDRDALLSQQARENAAVVMAETQLAQSRTAIEFQRTALEREMEMRRAEIAQAEAQVRDLESGSRTQEIDQAKAALAEITAQRDQAARDWERARKLYQDDDISLSQFEQFRTRNTQAQQAMQQAEQRLSLVREGPRKESIELAKAQRNRANAALHLSEAQRIDIRRREQDLETRRADIERARAQLKITETQLDDAAAVSPADGVILKKTVEAGEVVAAGTTVVTVGDIDHPWLRGYISERQLGRVKLGDKARLTTDSYPGKTYEGKVTFISSEAEFTPKQIQTPEERVKLVYRVKVAVANPHRELKSNMPADGVIEIGGR